MNILFITNTLPPVVDGVGDYTLNLAREFARHGHKVGIVCKCNARVRTGYEDIKVYPVVERWNGKGAEKVKQIISEGKYEVVSLQYVPHGFDPHGLPFAVASLSAMIKRMGIPLFTFFHEVCIGREGFHNLKRCVGACLMALIAKRIAKNSRYVATSIEHYKWRLLKMSIRDVALIPIPSNVPLCDMNSQEKISFRNCIANSDERIITLFGNRDFSQVVVAIRNLIKAGYKIKVVALGRVNASIPKDDFILFTGPKDIKDLSAYMEISDMLILPEDIRSGCSLKSGSLAASLQFGIPTITTKGFMTEKCLEDLFLFAKENSADEYECLLTKLLDDNEIAKDMREKNMQFAKTLTWDETYEKYIELISTIKA